MGGECGCVVVYCFDIVFGWVVDDFWKVYCVVCVRVLLDVVNVEVMEVVLVVEFVVVCVSVERICVSSDLVLFSVFLMEGELVLVKDRYDVMIGVVFVVSCVCVVLSVFFWILRLDIGIFFFWSFYYRVVCCMMVMGRFFYCLLFVLL